jgi:hypothetical protein
VEVIGSNFGDSVQLLEASAFRFPHRRLDTLLDQRQPGHQRRPA